MWKKIIDTEKPNANSYHHKITVEAHKKAEEMNGKVEPSDVGFKVQSCSVEDTY